MPIRVLIINDDPSWQDTMIDKLQAEGVICEAARGDDYDQLLNSTLEQLDERNPVRFDATLLDICMAGTDALWRKEDARTLLEETYPREQRLIDLILPDHLDSVNSRGGILLWETVKRAGVVHRATRQENHQLKTLLVASVHGDGGIENGRFLESWAKLNCGKALTRTNFDAIVDAVLSLDLRP